MKSQPGDLCPPEGHGAVVELDVRHLGLGLRLGLVVAWQGVGDGLAESLLGGTLWCRRLRTLSLPTLLLLVRHVLQNPQVPDWHTP